MQEVLVVTRSLLEERSIDLRFHLAEMARHNLDNKCMNEVVLRNVRKMKSSTQWSHMQWRVHDFLVDLNFGTW